MSHQICDACETVAHCKQHGCIPVQPIANTEAMRAAFDNAVERLTGRDMQYHTRAGTTGLEFAWEIWQAALAQAEQRQGVSAWVGLTEEEKDTSNIGWGMPVEYLLGYEAGMSRAEELLRAKNAAPQPKEPDLPSILQRQAS